MFLALREKLASSISEASGVTHEEALASIELPRGQFGDVASSICFSLAKKQLNGGYPPNSANLAKGRKTPAQLAGDIAKKLALPGWVSEAKADGPYINFSLSDGFFAELAATVAKEKGSFGKGKAKQGKTIIEFPSVNPNKPWHIGHLRNALLGDSIGRVLSFSGENVERADYIDDLGLQVAQSFWGYLNLGKTPSGKLDLWLGGEYVEVSKRFESEEKVQQEVRALVREMEAGTGRNAHEARALVERCVAAQYETAFKFGIYHDVLIFESDIVRTIFAEGMALLRTNKSIVKETEGKNAGCLVAKMGSPEFANMESPDKILIRSDGTATYTGKDVIFQLWKFNLLENDFAYSPFIAQPDGHECFMTFGSGKSAKFGHATRVINVIGMEQAYPQKVIKEILLSMGYRNEAESSVHLAYEHVWLEDSVPGSAGQAAEATATARKFSGRQGTWVGYTTDELYDEGVRRAEGKIKPEVQGAERAEIARTIAAAAIRFAFIRTTPEKKITFRWDDALSLEGDSAPYAIYAHARAHKISEKGGIGSPAPSGGIAPAERELLKKIMLLDFSIEASSRQLRPHIMAEYCLDLATLYNKFYNACPILSCEDQGQKAWRLAINFAALTAMKNALGSIGVKALDRM